MSIFQKKSFVVHIATFPPRECGIATFTQDLARSFDSLFSPNEESRIVAMNPDELTTYKYPSQVIDTISQHSVNDYKEVALRLNKNRDIKLVSIQHEFGIYGGDWGSYILEFIKYIEKPLVITFHTVLPTPDLVLKNVVIELTQKPQKIFVMTKISKNILIKEYGVFADKIFIVPHGIHQTPFTESYEIKKKLGLKNKVVLSTFGLLGRGKGIEYAIDALPNVIKKFPNVSYLIIGATHPEVLKREGEEYRNFLIEKIRKLGLSNHVRFYNKYLETKELLEFLEGTDVYLSLSLNPNQAVSGTLSYALGMGRPVISTAFAQAKEIVTPEVGNLVGFQNSEEISSAIIELLGNKEKRLAMEKTAYMRTRSSTWPNVTLSYMREYCSLVPEFERQKKNLPPIRLQHFSVMTDHFGMFQFANLTRPDPEWGYTIDDNARALIAMTEYYEKSRQTTALRLASTYLSFIEYMKKSDGSFDNYADKNKNKELDQNRIENLDDAWSRTLYSCARVASSGVLPEDFKNRAKSLFVYAQPFAKEIIWTKAAAFTIKALALWNDDFNLRNEKIKSLADYLVSCYEKNGSPQWQWFEDTMSYSNGVLPEALFIAHKIIGDDRYLAVAIQTLDFLCSWSFHDDMCVPIGQRGWFKKGEKKHIFDQQPEEVTALIYACKQAYMATGEKKYKNHALNAFWWYLGSNILNQMVYDQTTGGSYDGVGETEVNLNQGAESTVSYLLARLSIEDFFNN